MSGKTIALVLLTLAMAGPLAAERVALVIGNGAYGGEMPPLPNPGNDARAMAAKLRGLGFSVVEGTDLDRGGFFSKMKEFSRRAEGAEAALLFYAGHGVQADGKNYLIPVSMETLEDKTDLRADAVNLDYVLEQMKGRTNLLFLDACRNNPLTRGLSRSGSSAGRGLAMISAESMGGGVLIGYATQPDAVASDGSGRNSPYTEALLKHLGTPGESAGDMLTRVKADVEDATGGKQHPWMNASLRAPFYFVPGSAGAVVGPPPPVVTAPSIAAGADAAVSADDLSGTADQAWEAVKDSRNEEVLAAYIAKYEGMADASLWVEIANERLQELQISKVREAQERTWEAVKGSSSERVLELYIAKYRGVESASVWVKLAEERLQILRAIFNPGLRFWDCDVCPEMVVIPVGSFLMGYDEDPQHRVTIPAPFAAGAYEVTREEYGVFVRETGHAGGSGCRVWTGSEWKYREGADWRSPGYAQTGRDPVVCVNWGDAQAYVRWLSLKTGEEYRLLSEAEWEYAARAGSRTRYSFGDEITESDANYGRNIGKTQPVGSYRANGFGLYDVHGNVWEWMEDCWNESYAGAPNNGSVWERGNCSSRVVRGGSWYNNSRDLRSAFRFRNEAGLRCYDDGFRVARTLMP